MQPGPAKWVTTILFISHTHTFDLQSLLRPSADIICNATNYCNAPNTIPDFRIKDVFLVMTSSTAPQGLISLDRVTNSKSKYILQLVKKIHFIFLVQNCSLQKEKEEEKKRPVLVFAE